MQIKIEDFRDDPSKYIYLDGKGRIVYESLFSKNFDGDLKCLLDCIESNIAINENGEEFIMYGKAIKEYLKTNAGLLD